MNETSEISTNDDMKYSQAVFSESIHKLSKICDVNLKQLEENVFYKEENGRFKNNKIKGNKVQKAKTNGKDPRQ